MVDRPGTNGGFYGRGLPGYGHHDDDRPTSGPGAIGRRVGLASAASPAEADPSVLTCSARIWSSASRTSAKGAGRRSFGPSPTPLKVSPAWHCSTYTAMWTTT